MTGVSTCQDAVGAAMAAGVSLSETGWYKYHVDGNKNAYATYGTAVGAPVGEAAILLHPLSH